MADAPLDLADLADRVRRAVVSNDAGRAAEAVRRFRAIDRLVRRSGDDRPEVLLQHARVMLGLSAGGLDVTGDVEEALARLAEAEELARRAGAGHMQAAVRGQRGLLWLRLGETGRALAAFDEAVDLIDVATPYDQARMLLNRGALHLERGALQEARADLRRCLAVATAERDALMQFKAGHNLGYVDFLAGNIPRALSAIAEAAAVVEGEPHPVALLDQARVLREAGLVQEADEVLARASERLEAQRMAQDLGETELARADCALVDGDPASALALASSARRRFARRGNLRWQRRAELAVLRCETAAATAETQTVGEVAGSARQRLRRLAGRAEELAEVCRGEGRPDLAREAALLGGRCRLEAGERVALDESARLRPGDPLGMRLQVRELRARAARAEGRHAAETREIREGLAELHGYQSTFGSLDLRTASAVHGVALARLDLARALDSGRPSAVLRSIERSRAVSSRIAGVHPPADPETAGLLAELRRLEEEVQALRGDPEAVDRVSRLRSRVARIQREIRERAWHHEGYGDGSLAFASWRELLDAAEGAGTAFVSYARHDGRWLAVVVDGRRARLVELADVGTVEELVRRVRADLDALAMPRLPQPMQQVVTRSLTEGLHHLDAELLAPLRLGGRPLVVSGSGPLVVLPWSLLPSLRGLSVVVAPSASAWVAARVPQRTEAALPAGRGPRVHAVAGPGLHRAEDEARRVLAAWSADEGRGAGSSAGRLLVGEGATTAAVCSALEEGDVVHVAAHGTHQQESPLFSSLRLADGPLYAHELDGRERIAPFVALSACEAGLANVRPGDEGLGLASVLLHLGARSVLAGVARVRDDVASDVMEQVQRSVSSGADTARALADALVEQPDRIAPFVCFGATWRREN